MKTLHLTNAYHETSGGIRTFYGALLREGVELDREVVLVVPGPVSGVQTVGRGRIYTVAAPHAPAFDRRYRLLLPHRYLPAVNAEIVRILELEQPDLVEICDKYALPYLAAMLRKGWHRRVGRPTLVGLSCERFDDNMAAYLSTSSVARRFTQWYIRHIYGPPFDFHVAVSDYTAGELREALPDREPDFIRTLGMGVSAAAFGPKYRSPSMRAQMLKAAGGTGASVLLVYAGRLSPEKNLPLLIEAMRHLRKTDSRDFRLAIAGGGPLEAWLREQDRVELGRRIHWCGVLDPASLATHLASGDVFIHPNPREPFGIGPLEAMASGVPVVVPRAGGVLAYANDRNAWLATPTGADFARAIRAATDGDAMRVATAMQTAGTFDWGEAARRYFALYDELHARQQARMSGGVRHDASGRQDLVLAEKQG